MGKKYSAAIIGCGRIGTQTDENLSSRLPHGWLPLSHADAIKAVPGLNLVAVCDVDIDRARQAADKYGVKSFFADYRELIEKVKPDIISIATRTQGRVDIIAYAASHGVKGMHIEKPLANNLIECDRALEYLKKHGVCFSYGTTRRHMEIYRKAKSIIDSGELGKIEEIAIDYSRTMLLWNHPHSVDLLLFFANSLQIDFVQAFCSIKNISDDIMTVNDDPIVENALVRFENGINGTITSARGLNIRINCSKGSLIVRADGTGIDIYKSLNSRVSYFLDYHNIKPSACHSGTQNAISALLEQIKKGKPDIKRLTEVRIGSNILFAMVYSTLHKGQMVSLKEVPLHFTITGKHGDLYA